MSTEMALKRVFNIMAATYGSTWDRSLGQAPIADVKTVWANALDNFMHSDAAERAIDWALGNLPAKVPNSIEFRDLCRQAPSATVPQLPAPTVNPEIAAKVLSSLRVEAVKHDSRAWAKAILTGHKGGLSRSPAVVAMARRAMGEDA